jgi:hypothetical protein
MMFRFLKRFVRIGIIISLSISLVISILVICHECQSYTISLTLEGFKFFFSRITLDGIELFISQFEPFSSIYGLTIALIGIFLIIDQIEISTHQKGIKSFDSWKENIDKVLKEYEESNPAIYKHIDGNITKIYDFISSVGFRIENKSNLKRFMNKFIVNNIDEFETYSIAYIKKNGIYDSKNTSYARTDVQKLLSLIVDPDVHYMSYWRDFTKIYNNRLYTFQGDITSTNIRLIRMKFNFLKRMYSFQLSISKHVE